MFWFRRGKPKVSSDGRDRKRRASRGSRRGSTSSTNKKGGAGWFGLGGLGGRNSREASRVSVDPEDPGTFITNKIGMSPALVPVRAPHSSPPSSPPSMPRRKASPVTPRRRRERGKRGKRRGGEHSAAASGTVSPTKSVASSPVLVGIRGPSNGRGQDSISMADARRAVLAFVLSVECKDLMRNPEALSERDAANIIKAAGGDAIRAQTLIRKLLGVGRRFLDLDTLLVAIHDSAKGMAYVDNESRQRVVDHMLNPSCTLLGERAQDILLATPIEQLDELITEGHGAATLIALLQTLQAEQSVMPSFDHLLMAIRKANKQQYVATEADRKRILQYLCSEQCPFFRGGANDDSINASRAVSDASLVGKDMLQVSAPDRSLRTSADNSSVVSVRSYENASLLSGRSEGSLLSFDQLSSLSLPPSLPGSFSAPGQRAPGAPVPGHVRYMSQAGDASSTGSTLVTQWDSESHGSQLSALSQATSMSKYSSVVAGTSLEEAEPTPADVNALVAEAGGVGQLMLQLEQFRAQECRFKTMADLTHAVKLAKQREKGDGEEAMSRIDRNRRAVADFLSQPSTALFSLHTDDNMQVTGAMLDALIEAASADVPRLLQHLVELDAAGRKFGNLTELAEAVSFAEEHAKQKQERRAAQKAILRFLARTPLVQGEHTISRAQLGALVHKASDCGGVNRLVQMLRDWTATGRRFAGMTELVAAVQGESVGATDEICTAIVAFLSAPECLCVDERLSLNRKHLARIVRTGGGLLPSLDLLKTLGERGLRAQSADHLLAALQTLAEEKACEHETACAAVQRYMNRAESTLLTPLRHVTRQDVETLLHGLPAAHARLLHKAGLSPTDDDAADEGPLLLVLRALKSLEQRRMQFETVGALDRAARKLLRAMVREREKQASAARVAALGEDDSSRRRTAATAAAADAEGGAGDEGDNNKVVWKLPPGRQPKLRQGSVPDRRASNRSNRSVGSNNSDTHSKDSPRDTPVKRNSKRCNSITTPGKAKPMLSLRMLRRRSTKDSKHSSDSHSRPTSPGPGPSDKDDSEPTTPTPAIPKNSTPLINGRKIVRWVQRKKKGGGGGSSAASRAKRGPRSPQSAHLPGLSSLSSSRASTDDMPSRSLARGVGMAASDDLPGRSLRKRYAAQGSETTDDGLDKLDEEGGVGGAKGAFAAADRAVSRRKKQKGRDRALERKRRRAGVVNAVLAHLQRPGNALFAFAPPEELKISERDVHSLLDAVAEAWAAVGDPYNGVNSNGSAGNLTNLAGIRHGLGGLASTLDSELSGAHSEGGARSDSLSVRTRREGSNQKLMPRLGGGGGQGTHPHTRIEKVVPNPYAEAPESSKVLLRRQLFELLHHLTALENAGRRVGGVRQLADAVRAQAEVKHAARQEEEACQAVMGAIRETRIVNVTTVRRTQLGELLQAGGGREAVLSAIREAGHRRRRSQEYDDAAKAAAAKGAALAKRRFSSVESLTRHVYSVRLAKMGGEGQQGLDGVMPPPVMQPAGRQALKGRRLQWF